MKYTADELLEKWENDSKRFSDIKIKYHLY
nr:DUF1343 domain-containing protein [Thermoanaerobacterium thermosaccharolyticum]